MRKRIWLLAILTGMFVAGLMISPVLAVEGLDGATEEALYDLQATMYPPKVWKISVSPETPAADEAVNITAEIHNDETLTDDETMNAWIVYTIDQGEKWQQVEMESEDDMNWTGAIPGQKSGTEVWWMIRAEDSSTNIYFETPCYVDDVTKENKWPIEDVCLVVGAYDEEPVDDPEVKAENDMDIIETKYGESEKYVYVQMKVQGTVNQGSSSPMKIFVYGGAMVNPDRGTDILDAGVAFIYAPLAKLANFDTCMTVIKKGGTAEYGKYGIECHSEGPYLMFQLEKAYGGENPSNYYKFATLTVVATSIQPPKFRPNDWTHVTSMQRTQRSYTVK